MKKLPITKEAFEKSKYFTNKYGKLEYVSESGKLFKTTKGKIMKFKESAIPMNEMEEDEDEFDGRWVAGMFCLQDEVGSSKIFYFKEDALKYIRRLSKQAIRNGEMGEDEELMRYFNTEEVMKNVEKQGWAYLDADNIAFIDKVEYTPTDWDEVLGYED